MAYTTINKGSSYFNTVLYTGNGTSQSITGVGFQPDMVWGKIRNTTRKHNIYDVIRGVQQRIVPNDTAAEDTVPGVTAFNSDGFSVGSETDMNQNGNTFVAWNWKANGAGVSNTAGTLTSTVSANTTAGFSIVTYTATSGTSSIGHGLGVAPSMIILKTRNQVASWIVGSAVNGWDKYLLLNLPTANTTDRRMFSPTAGTDPTSTLFWSDQAAIGSAGTMVAYCFAAVKGYSKFGSYVGTGSATSTPFIYTGFKPALVITKPSSAADSWSLTDIPRDNAVGGGNGTGARLQANNTDAENTNSTWASIQKYSNGFSPQGTDNVTNASGTTYIYMAFAENPFVTSGGIPVTAR